MIKYIVYQEGILQPMEDQRTPATAQPSREPDEIARKKNFLIRCLYAAVVLGIAIFICRKAIPALMPFVIAFVVSLLLKPVVRFLHEICHVQKNIASFLVVLLFYALVGMLIIVLGAKLVGTGRTFVLSLPTYYTTRVEPLLYEMGDMLEMFFARLDPAVAATLNDMLAEVGNTLRSSVTTFSMSAVKFLTNFAISMPSVIVDTIIMIIATVFITTDLQLLKRFLKHQFPEKTQLLLSSGKRHLTETLKQYIRSYGLILSITFVELCIGLSIIRIPKTPLIALLIATFDILPVVGCGTVLIPWTIIAAVLGNFPRAIYIGCMYLIITAIRNIIEPRILGDHIGLNPLVMLVCFYVGFVTMGILGMFLLPVTMIALEKLQEWGYIHLWKNPAPKPEPQPVEPLRSVLARKWKKK